MKLITPKQLMVKDAFTNDVVELLRNIDCAKTTITKIVHTTTFNNYVADNITKLIDAKLLHCFHQFLLNCKDKVDVYREEIKFGAMKHIPDKEFDNFVKSLYKMDDEVTKCLSMVFV